MKSMIHEKRSNTVASYNSTNVEHSNMSTGKNHSGSNNIFKTNGEKPQSISLWSTTTDMLNALPHISPKNNKSSSPHDNSHELSTSCQ